MPNILAYLQRKSLFTTLLLSILLLAGLSIVSSSLGWYLLNNIRDSQRQLSVSTLPLISAAQTMSNQATAITLMAPQIALSDNQSDLDALYLKLDRHLEVMTGIKTPIETSGEKSAITRVIGSTLEDIHVDFDSMYDAMLEKFIIQKLIDNTVSEMIININKMDALIDQRNDQLSVEIYDLTTAILRSDIDDNSRSLRALSQLNSDSQTLFALNRKAIVVKTLLQQMSEIDTYRSLAEAKSTIDFQARLMVGLSVGLSDPVSKKALAFKLAKFYQQITQEKNIGNLQKQLITINLRLLEINDRVKNDVFFLNNQIDDVVVDVESNASMDATNINSAVALGSNMLLGVAILSLLVSVVVIWFFVIRKVILPLAEVTSMIRQLSGNKLDITIKSYSMVELNEVSKALVVFRDNSLALNEHKNGLIENNFLLTRANDDLNAFVHVASHDLKTPLRGIQVLSDFIVTDIRDGHLGDAQSNVRLLQKRISRLTELLNSVLNYTKLDPVSGKLLQVDLMVVIQEAFNSVENNENFTLELPHELPVCRVVESDLQSIFTNLFSNAISHHDQAQGLITIYYRETDDSYVFDVCDDGPGIAEEFQQRIFSVLQKLKNKDEVEGSGLGLSYVKRLLETRGGSINIISNPAQTRGSRFIFHYPKIKLEAKQLSNDIIK